MAAPVDVRAIPVWARIALAILVATIAIAAWAWRPVTPPPSLPELELTYPGSTEVSRAGSETSVQLMLSADASADEIVEFYRAQLEPAGFVFAGGAQIPTTIEALACAWQRDGRVVRLAIMDLEDMNPAYVAENLAGKRTLYRWGELIGTDEPATRPCNILREGDPVPSLPS